MKGRDDFTTQCYVQGESLNGRDDILNRIWEAKARASIIVPFVPVRSSRIGELTARFDIVLRATPSA